MILLFENEQCHKIGKTSKKCISCSLQPTTIPVTPKDSFPVAAIVAIAVGGYLLLVSIALVIRQCLLVSKFQKLLWGDGVHYSAQH